MIVGGRKGAAWAINLIISPVRSYVARRTAAAVSMLVAIVVLHYLGISILRR